MASACARDPDYKQALRQLYVDLPSKIQRSEAITKKLFAKGILDDQEFARLRQIHQNRGAFDQCEELILVMRGKSDQQVEEFLAILTEDGQPEVVELIRQTAAQYEMTTSFVQQSDAELGAAIGNDPGASCSQRDQRQGTAQAPATQQIQSEPSLEEELEVISSLMENGSFLKDLPSKGPRSILVLGKTGNGKSKLCNNICKTRDFHTAGVPGGVTKELKMVTKTFKGRKWTIVDTPGTMDPKDPQAALDEIAGAIAKSDEGYDAFLIIIKYPARHTEEDQLAVKKLQLIFGKEVGPFGLVVFTGGDTYRNEMVDEGKSIEFENNIKTLRLSTANTLSDTLRFYNGGWVLVDNFERDPAKMDRQIYEMLALVDIIRAKNKSKYGKAIFEAVRQRAREYKAKHPNYTDEEVYLEKKDRAKEVMVEELKKAGYADCFPGNAMVIRYPGDEIPICDVTVGDQILVLLSNGCLGYDTVFMIGHSDSLCIMVNAITLTTSGKHRLTASSGHYIHTTNPQNTKMKPQLMRDVSVGDYVLVAHINKKSHGHHMTHERVTQIEHTFTRGKYNPMTLSGTIVVDRVVGTVYEQHISPAVAHWLLGPVRGLYCVAPWVLAAVNGHRYNGIPTWAYAVLKSVCWVNGVVKGWDKIKME